MRFHIEQHFSHPVGSVEAALLQPELLELLAGSPRLGRPELLDERSEGPMLHRRVRFRFTGDLSPAVTSVVDPARLTWVEESTFDRQAHRGRHHIVPDHYGGRLRCDYTTELAPDGEGTLRVAEGEVVVRFPLVGSRVERAIVGGLTEHAGREQELVERWLTEQAG